MLEVIKYSKIYRLAVHFSNRTFFFEKKWSFHVVYKIVVLLILNLLNF